MSDYCQIKLLFENNTNFTIYYSFFEKYTFVELLEYISYNYPEKNICLCSQIREKIDKSSKGNSKYEDIDLNTNFKEYIKNRNYQFQPINLYIFKKKCECNSIIKDNLKKSKTEIIKILENSSNFQNTEFKQKLEKEQNDNKIKINSLEKEKQTLKKNLIKLEEEKEEKKKNYFIRKREKTTKK